LKIRECVKLTTQCRWFDAGKVKGHDTRGQDFKTDISGSNIDVGLRFSVCQERCRPCSGRLQT
jgi:hypothetical protein